MGNIAVFAIKSALLGLGLSADAFSVSVADGLAEPGMRRGKMLLTAGVFALFQALMPILGWLFAHTAAVRLDGFAAYIPWVAAALLLFIGGKMILDSVHGSAVSVPEGTERGAFLRAAASAAAHRAASAADPAAVQAAERVPAGTRVSAADAAAPPAALAAGALPTQAVATSIDALSAGFAAASQPLAPALISAVIIGTVTFAVCTAGLLLGKQAGRALSGKAQILGGAILIAIGISFAFPH